MTQGPSFVEGWAQVFDIPTNLLPHAKEREVVRMLGLMHDAVDEVAESLSRTEIERETYESTLNRIRSAFALQLFHSNWEQVRQQLTSEAMGVFAFIAQVLPDDETALPEQELATLREEVEALLKRTADGGLPEWAKAILFRQLEFILTALREYPIRGAASFQDASVRAVIEWSKHQTEMSEFADDPEVQATRALWPQIVRIGKRIVLINGFIASVLGTGKLGLEIVKETRQLTAGTTASVVTDGESQLDGPDPTFDVP